MKCFRLVFAFVSMIHSAPGAAQTLFAREIVASHNTYRAAVQVPPVTWDDRLAAEALQWARTLASEQRLEHSPALDEGENIWVGTAQAYSVADMVGSWGIERRFYTGGVFPNVSRTGRFDAVGHYTQVVWRDTHRVGCGLARAAGFDYLVCRYSHPGNVVGQVVY